MDLDPNVSAQQVCFHSRSGTGQLDCEVHTPTMVDQYWHVSQFGYVAGSRAHEDLKGIASLQFGRKWAILGRKSVWYVALGPSIPICLFVETRYSAQIW